MFGFITKIFNKKPNAPPKREEVEQVDPYYTKYDGDRGSAQFSSRVGSDYIALFVNSSDGGKVLRVMKVTSRRFFFDFGTTCTEIGFERTDHILS